MLKTDDIVAIYQLYHLYGHIHDADQWDRMNEIFADDVEFDVSAFGAGSFKGIEALKKMYSGRTHPASTNVSNVYAYEENGEVRVMAKSMSPGPEGEFQCADYFDTLARTPKGWRVAKRRIQPRSFQFKSQMK